MALDLTDPLCSDSPDRADIGQLGLTAVDEAVSAANDVGGAFVQRGQHVLQPRMLLSVQENLVRLIVGLEDPGEIWADLEQALGG